MSLLDERATGASEGRTPPRLARLWTVVAVLCPVASAACLFTGRINATFVVAVLGCVAWFLNVRVQLRRANREADEREAAARDEEDETEADEAEAEEGTQ